MSTPSGEVAVGVLMRASLIGRRLVLALCGLGMAGLAFVVLQAKSGDPNWLRATELVVLLIWVIAGVVFVCAGIVGMWRLFMDKDGWGRTMMYFGGTLLVMVAVALVVDC